MILTSCPEIMNYKLLILLILLNATSFAQSSKTALPTPPNCIWLYDSVFIDKTEIANYHWLEFLNAIKQDSSLAYYKSMIPDSTVWSGPDPFRAMLDIYIRRDSKEKKSSDSLFIGKLSVFGDLLNKEFLFYPVVGITYRQASAFCAWRSKAINNQNENRNEQFRIKFRLPTEGEWIYAASAGLDTNSYAYGYKDYKVKTTVIDDPNFYWNQIKDTTQLSRQLFHQIFLKYKKYGDEPFFNCTKNFLKYFTYGMMRPSSVYDLSNRPPKINKRLSILHENKIDRSSEEFSNAKANGYGISNIIGNAAEMTLQEGIARGGSWAHSLDNCKVSTRYYYYTTTNWLGFRCVAEVHKE